MKDPAVSVIMPAYNHERYVGEAIESVLNQTFTDFEFIIINDGSTDGTDRVIRTYNDPRILYYTQDNIDAPNTLNRGLSLAKGKYVSIINSDDVYHPERLSCLVETAEAKDAMLVITDLVFIDESSAVIRDPSHTYNSWYSGLKSIYLDTGSLEKAFFIGNMAVTTSNLFFRSELIKEVGFFNSYRYTHDYDFILRALIRYRDRFLFLDDKKYLFYRLHGKNTIKESPLQSHVETVDILLKRILDFIHSERDKTSAETALKSIQDLYMHAFYLVKGMENTRSWKITAPLRWLFERYLNMSESIKRFMNKGSFDENRSGNP